MLCLLEQKPELFNTDDRMGLVMKTFACSWCKQFNNKEKGDPLHDMFMVPLSMMLDPMSKALPGKMKVFPLMGLLKNFEPDNSPLKFIEKMKTCRSVEEEIKNLKILSPFGYLQFMIDFLTNDRQDDAFRLLYFYFKANVTVNGGGYSLNYVFKENEIDDSKDERVKLNPNAKGQFIGCEKKPFLSVGHAMDEGHTQKLTVRFSDAIHEKFNMEKKNNTDYKLEIKFIQMIQVKFPEAKYNELYNKGRGLQVIDELVKFSKSKCDYIDIIRLSDSQKWREVNNIVRAINV